MAKSSVLLGWAAMVKERTRHVDSPPLPQKIVQMFLQIKFTFSYPRRIVDVYFGDYSRHQGFTSYEGSFFLGLKAGFKKDPASYTVSYV